jgi:RimJ/RimL family protein N-acetyltransferase
MYVLAPIQKKERSLMWQHLHGLSSDDRHLRFGHAVSEDSLAQYVARIDMDKDIVIGVFNDKRELFGFAHGAKHNALSSVEIGLSIDGKVQGQGLGDRLVQAVLDEAKKREIEQAVIQTLAQNHALRRILKKQPWVGSVNGGEFTATLDLNPPLVKSKRMMKPK